MSEGSQPQHQHDPATPAQDELLERVLQGLLELAAKKDALRTWARGMPVDDALKDAPPVEARRDDDGTLGVFRFFEIVADGGDGASVDARRLTAKKARERIDALQDERVRVGDEVGVELPLARLAAIALADVDVTLAGRDDLLPIVLRDQLNDRALADALVARLSALRGTPPHVPLRQVIADHGGDAVLWTSVTAEPSELCVLVQRSDVHKLVVVPNATSSAGHAALLRALAPAPADRSLWRFFEAHGPALLCGPEHALWSHDVLGRRLSLEIKAVVVSADPTVYGVARARARLSTWMGDKIVDEVDALVPLSMDLPRAVELPWPEGDALQRIEAAATAYVQRTQQRLCALVEQRAPKPGDVLGGSAVLRVMARAFNATVHERAEPCAAREGPHSDEELLLRFADVVVALSPADDVVRAHTASGDSELFASGALCDGDVDAWRALSVVFAHALAHSDADVELAFEQEDGSDAHTAPTTLSSWLLALGQTPDAQLRWPPRDVSQESANVAAWLYDRFVDGGPLLDRGPVEPSDEGSRAQPSRTKR